MTNKSPVKFLSHSFLILILQSVLATAGNERVDSAAPAPAFLSGLDVSGKIVRPDGPYQWTSQKNVMVEMRDGIHLLTDVFLPIGLKKAPMILIRTPYGSKGFWPEFSGNGTVEFFVEHGFIVAVQNTRGRNGSEGNFIPTLGDDTDTYDTMTWASTQPWFDGNIGTFGCSYLGESQVVASKNPHPAWKAAIPMASGGANNGIYSRYRPFALWNGGAAELAMGISWFLEHVGKAETQDAKDVAEIAEHRPTADALLVNGDFGTGYEEFISEPPGSAYWNRFPYLREGETVNVPSLFIEGWYDYGPQDSAVQFLAARDSSAISPDSHRLILDSTTHCMQHQLTSSSRAGDLELGDARLNYWDAYLDWFDHYLRKGDKGIDHIPSVQAYHMGANTWRSYRSWPPESSIRTSWYLEHSGALTAHSPTVAGSVSYEYDPNDPVPTVGSSACCVPPIYDGKSPEGAYDQEPLDNRKDIVRFVSSPLSTALDVVGPIEVVLYVSTNVRDTDFTAKLIDVYPDGTALNVVDGIQRMRWREMESAPSFLEPGKVYEVQIDLQATSMRFDEGHRMRLDISSSNFPRYDRNWNVETSPSKAVAGAIAQNSIHVSAEYPSRVVMHVLEPE